MRTPQWSLILAVWPALMLGGCTSSGDRQVHPAVTTADFEGPATRPATTPPAAQAAQAPSPATRPAPPPAAKAGASDPVVLDAMIGQVNGKAIYVSTIFNDIDDALKTLGNKYPRDIFRYKAREVIYPKLDEVVQNALILGDAERDLSPPEQTGLLAMLKERRADLVRVEGSGSAMNADQNSLLHTGETIDQRMQDERSRILEERYLQKKLYPKINVTRKNIERYYDAHYDEFNPPPGRTIRLILTTDAAGADKIDKRLAQGDPFDKVAGSDLNGYRQDTAGLWPEPVTRNDVLAFPALNDAMAKLKAGQWSGRITTPDGAYWWVKVDRIVVGKGQPLDDVQLQIKDLLERQQFKRLTIEYRAKLLAEGSYTQIEQMRQALLDIAVNRYTLPE